MSPQLPEGLKVKYQHLRIAGNPYGILASPREIAVQRMEIEPRGGQTIACIFRDGGDQEIAVGIANCNDKDNYNKKIGRDIALGRALKAMREGT